MMLLSTRTMTNEVDFMLSTSKITNEVAQHKNNANDAAKHKNDAKCHC